MSSKIVIVDSSSDEDEVTTQEDYDEMYRNLPKRHHLNIDTRDPKLMSIRTKFINGDKLQKSVMETYLNAHGCYPSKRDPVKNYVKLMQDVIDGEIGMPIGI